MGEISFKFIECRCCNNKATIKDNKYDLVVLRFDYITTFGEFRLFGCKDCGNVLYLKEK